MSKPLNISELIDQYLQGSLQGKALQNFEDKLAKDPALREELELQQLVNESVVDHGLLSWKEAIQKESSHLKQKNATKKKVMIGSAGLLLLAGAIWYGSQQNTTTPDQEKTPPVKPVDSTYKFSSPEMVEETEKSSAPAKSTSSPALQKTEENSSPDTTLNIVEVIPEPQDKQEVPTQDSATSEKPQKTLNDTPTVSPCEQIEFLAFFEAKATCEGQSGGEVNITEVYGGTPPYLYRLQSTTSWQDKTIIKGLSAGEYQLEVKDGNGCQNTVDKTVTITAKNCYKPAKGFNPDYETWEYKGHWNNTAKVTIRNKAGMIILEKDVNDIFVWDGLDNQGQRVPSGLYLYTIDVPQQQQVAGTVTVIY